MLTEAGCGVGGCVTRPSRHRQRHRTGGWIEVGSYMKAAGGRGPGRPAGRAEPGSQRAHAFVLQWMMILSCPPVALALALCCAVVWCTVQCVSPHGKGKGREGERGRTKMRLVGWLAGGAVTVLCCPVCSAEARPVLLRCGYREVPSETPPGCYVAGEHRRGHCAADH